MTIAADQPTIEHHRPALLALLREGMSQHSISGNEAGYVTLIADWARDQGMEVDLWQADESALAHHALASQRHLPLDGRPTAVIRIAGTGGGRSLIFNGHTDVVPAGDPASWNYDPWACTLVDGRVFGRGACDVKGPILSALWAMKHIASSEDLPRGDVLLELVPGEEDCVGLGTLTSLVRGWRADACVVLEPTESQPRNASRPGLRFEIIVHGTAVHGTMKWLGRDAIADARRVLDALDSLQSEWNAIDRDELFNGYHFAPPLTVDAIHGGEWQGMLCDRCVIAGYMELLPLDDIDQWQTRLESEIATKVGPETRLSFRYGDRYAGHRISPRHPLCEAAGLEQPIVPWQGFNSGCEAGLRAGLLGTPTLVWGPGSLAQAHAPNEFVELKDIEHMAAQFVQLIRRWCNGRDDGEVTL
ncbi:MAG: M20 family metallopeptidase [Tepidisphaeraceae bacterium]